MRYHIVHNLSQKWLGRCRLHPEGNTQLHSLCTRLIDGCSPNRAWIPACTRLIGRGSTHRCIMSTDHFERLFGNLESRPLGIASIFYLTMSIHHSKTDNHRCSYREICTRGLIVDKFFSFGNRSNRLNTECTFH